MKNIYLYGMSDDLAEIESDFGRFESYNDIKINNILAHYEYGNGDWGIRLVGVIPPTWKVTTIAGNAPFDYRWKPDAGQFIHIQVPDDERIVFERIEYNEERD